MILEPALLALALLADPTPTPSPSPSPAADPPLPPAPAVSAAEAFADPPPATDWIEQFRLPVDELVERSIGTASRAVRVDWRRKSVGVGITGSVLLELNNFTTERRGVVLRRPSNSLMTEFAMTRVRTHGSASADKIELTPYRQVGRPSRWELDFNVGYPIAEGVATARPGAFPATELVLTANAGLRYLYYPGAFSGVGWERIARSILLPQLTSRELDNLEGRRPGGMQIDTARYALLGGLSMDVYFHPSGFLSPRAMVALPTLGTELGWWWEVSLGTGWFF